MMLTGREKFDLAANDLYGMDNNYRERLWTFCQTWDWTLHPNQNRLCVGLLENPAHVCNHREPTHDKLTRSRFNLDHAVLLRRGPARRPEQWAILSQPYSDSDPSGQAEHLVGEAPYGFGTHGLLYYGLIRR